MSQWASVCTRCSPPPVAICTGSKTVRNARHNDATQPTDPVEVRPLKKTAGRLGLTWSLSTMSCFRDFRDLSLPTSFAMFSVICYGYAGAATCGSFLNDSLVSCPLPRSQDLSARPGQARLLRRRCCKGKMHSHAAPTWADNRLSELMSLRTVSGH